MLKLKLLHFGHLMWRTFPMGKDPDAGKAWRQEEKGTPEDEMIGWHHWFNGHEFEQALGVYDGQGSLACCDSWDCKESDTTKWMNWTELNWGDPGGLQSMGLQRVGQDLVNEHTWMLTTRREGEKRQCQETIRSHLSSPIFRAYFMKWQGSTSQSFFPWW